MAKKASDKQPPGSQLGDFSEKSQYSGFIKFPALSASFAVILYNTRPRTWHNFAVSSKRFVVSGFLKPYLQATHRMQAFQIFLKSSNLWNLSPYEDK